MSEVANTGRFVLSFSTVYLSGLHAHSGIEMHKTIATAEQKQIVRTIFERM